MQHGTDDDSAPDLGGRPTKYKPEFDAQAAKLCELGATDSDLAEFFDVTTRTIDNWKIVHEGFFQAVKNAKDAADDRVERSLYQRAVGYQTEAVKIFMPAGSEKPVYAPYRENIQPDTTAAIFWLKNRRKDKWRDVNRNEQTGPDGGPIQTENHHVGLDEFARRIASISARTAADSGNEPPDGATAG